MLVRATDDMTFLLKRLATEAAAIGHEAVEPTHPVSHHPLDLIGGQFLIPGVISEKEEVFGFESFMALLVFTFEKSGWQTGSFSVSRVWVEIEFRQGGIHSGPRLRVRGPDVHLRIEG